MNSSTFHVTSAAIGGMIAIAFAAADLFYFHQLPKDTDLLIFFGGLAAFGVTGAYSAGLHSDPVATPTPKVVPPGI